VKGTNCEAPHYAVFTSLPPLPPYWIQIFGTPCPKTPSHYVISSV